MSSKSVIKKVDAIVCDFCDEEIDTKTGDYCYHYIRSSTGDTINGYQYGVKHFLFSWYRPNKKRYEAKEYVRYDFHAACFDKLVVKFLAEKEIGK